MAITDSKQNIENNTEQLDATKALTAGLLSLLFTGGIAGVVFWQLTTNAYDSLDTTLFGLFGTICSAMAITSLVLIRRKPQALWILMIFWLMLSIKLVIQGLYFLLGEKLPLPFALDEMSYWLFTAGGLLCCLAAIMGLVSCTPQRSRIRYGLTVGVSVGLTVLLVIAANMLAAVKPIQKDCETLGRYRLSDRAKMILGEISADQKVRLSAIYADANSTAETQEQRDKKQKTQQELQRVMELLKRIHQFNKNIQVENASNEAARARLIARLRNRVEAKVASHKKLTQDIRSKLPALLAQLKTAETNWRQHASYPYLAQWKTASSIADNLAKLRKSLTELDKAIQKELTAKALPNHVAIVNALLANLKKCNKTLTAQQMLLQRYSQWAAKVQGNLPKARKAMLETAVALRQCTLIFTNAIGQTKTSEAKLKELAIQSGQVSIKAREAQETLDKLAGNNHEDTQLLLQSAYWPITVTGPSGKTIRTTCSKLFFDTTLIMDDLRSKATGIYRNAKPAAQERYLQGIGQILTRWNTNMLRWQKQVNGTLEKMTTVDPKSQKLLDAANKGQLFATLQTPIRQWLQAGSKLETPKTLELPPNLNEPNIIVLETADKIAAIPYGLTWPFRVMPSRTGDSSQQRFFNGDAAVSSQLLVATQKKPFGRVLLTFLPPARPTGQTRYTLRQPPSPIPLDDLKHFAARAIESNFSVQLWNLNDDIPNEDGPTNEKSDEKKNNAKDKDASADKPAKDDYEYMPGDVRPTKPEPETPKKTPVKPTLPTVLVIVPPPPAIGPTGIMPIFKKEHQKKIAQAIDNGASAIFLTTWQIPLQIPALSPKPIPRPYALGNYLKSAWGIDVKTDQLTIQCSIPHDAQAVDQYRMTLRSLFLMQFSLSNHKIVAPLQGQRLVLPMTNPIQLVPAAKRPAGVQITPLIEVPKTYRNIWATQKLPGDFTSESTGGKLIAPTKYDTRTPLTLAVVATRSGKGLPPGRIIVAGCGTAFTDPYQITPIPDENGQLLDPPRANLDFLINSMYWLIGKETYIAKSVHIDPVAAMDKTTQTIIWALCVIGLPAVVLLIGGVVMMVRRIS